jgi:hypothetical protein
MHQTRLRELIRSRPGEALPSLAKLAGTSRRHAVHIARIAIHIRDVRVVDNGHTAAPAMAAIEAVSVPGVKSFERSKRAPTNAPKTKAD